MIGAQGTVGLYELLDRYTLELLSQSENLHLNHRKL